MPAVFQPDVFHSHNFIKDATLVAKLIERCQIGPEDVVYEIGPGRGIITQQLALLCQRVVAIEKDPALAVVLNQRFAHLTHVEIHTCDFLEYPLPQKPYRVFSNIPFNLTSAIMSRLTEAANPPQDAWLWMQKEAAEMYLGVRRESMRSILLKPWFQMEIVHYFKPTDFFPVPQVDVVLLRLCKRAAPLVSTADRQNFRNFVISGFTSHHPVLGGFLKDAFSWGHVKHVARALDLNLKSKPSSLKIDQWMGLFEYFKVIGKEQTRRAVAGSEQRLRQQQSRLDKIHRTRKGKKWVTG
jgi:23S rRNA (adenine-N6)-dimethyltransferase